MYVALVALAPDTGITQGTGARSAMRGIMGTDGAESVSGNTMVCLGWHWLRRERLGGLHDGRWTDAISLMIDRGIVGRPAMLCRCCKMFVVHVLFMLELLSTTF